MATVAEVERILGNQDPGAAVIVVADGRVLATRGPNPDAKVPSAVVVAMGAPEVDEPRRRRS